ncbi:hypothetical protein PVAP13_3NG176825 [Panicum virgatum]|uniref:Uncharacterized protein n=1 Tax=Panicum virgatum TaxID=38727 RepID=A0A8T0U461_PANVG|nr:hypothetical protein PVAP13_3NG176825 [Panicum virgatum]
MSSPSFSFPHMPHPPVRPWAPTRNIARRSAAALLLLARRRTPLARPPPHPPCSPPCALLLAPRCAPFTGEREVEVREAAAELAVVCAAMKDSGGFGMCCFLHGGGGGENQRSSRPELGIGKQEEHAAASRGPDSTRARGARRRTGVRAGGAHGGGNRRGGTGVRPGGAAPALPTRPTSATRPPIRGASALWPPGGGGGDGDDGASVVEGAGQMLEGRDKVSSRSGRSSRGRGEERMEEADDVWGRMSVRRE